MRGRVAIITGAFGALGSAVARAFLDQQWNVGLVDAAKQPAPALAQELARPQALLCGGVDLTEITATRAAFEAVAARFGRLDALINIAGGFRWQTVADGDPGAWDQLYAMNLKTAVVACKMALPHLIAAGSGHIVNIGANAAARAAAGMGAYAASKAGVQRLTESLAQELKDRGITVNAILPGTIDTAQNRRDMPDADTRTWVTPQAIAGVILFLVSPAAAAITGAAIPVTGRG
ncbi:MAG: SDR family NAD(P)-dependent oxidoreductase [Proteobacteria bacterium]|nr:SDR family NAD(P)-dependent oxidoreductase [Pseudomonadota bacterium]